MKKKNNIIFIVAIILLISLITILLINNTNSSKGSLKEITFKQLQQKIEQKETFVVVLSQTTCHNCVSFKPKLKTITKRYDITIYYLDYDKYDEDTINEILEYLNFDGGTPTTFFFKEGSEISIMSRLVGDMNKEKVIAALKKYEYIENE